MEKMTNEELLRAIRKAKEHKKSSKKDSQGVEA